MSLQDHCESASLASTADGSATVLLLFNNNLARWYWFQYCSFVGVCVGAFVNIITHEPFEISCNFYGSKIWLKARIYSQCLHSDALQRLVVSSSSRMRFMRHDWSATKRRTFICRV